MSLSKYIVKMLNLKDEDISFDNNFYSEEVIKEVRSQVYYAKLTYKPKSCPCCGHVYDEKIQRHVFKTSTITLPNVSNMNAYLKLKKQRMICHHCGDTLVLSTSVVNPNCFISNNT